MLLGDRLDHVFEERMPIRGHQRRRVPPVHLELAVGVLVVVLVRPPAQRLHRIADRRDHVVAAHQRGLVVARLRLPVGADPRSRCRQARSGRTRTPRRSASRSPAPRPASITHCSTQPRRLLDRLARHPGIGRQPADLGLPRQLDQAGRVRHRQHVRIGRRHVEPGRKPGEPRPIARHPRDRRGRHQLRPQRAEQIEVARSGNT